MTWIIKLSKYDEGLYLGAVSKFSMVRYLCLMAYKYSFLSNSKAILADEQ